MTKLRAGELYRISNQLPFYKKQNPLHDIRSYDDILSVEPYKRIVLLLKTEQLPLFENESSNMLEKICWLLYKKEVVFTKLIQTKHSENDFDLKFFKPIN